MFLQEDAIDEFNPMEQVAQAIQRRSQALSAPPSSLMHGGSGNVDTVINTMAADAAALGVDSSLFNLKSSTVPVSSTTSASTMTSESLDSGLVALGWESALDPASGKSFYFRRSTNERRWDKPSLLSSEQIQQQEQLPDGWRSTLDTSSGKMYYYHTSGKTSWEKPI